MTPRAPKYLFHSDIQAHQDPAGLTDFIKMAQPLGVTIQKVGINRFRIPIRYQYQDRRIMGHDAEASLFVHCSPEKSGINMSRLCLILTQETEKHTVGPDLFRSVLRRMRKEMRDKLHDPLVDSSYLEIKFKAALKQLSLKSPHWGWQYYDTTWKAEENSQGQIKWYLTVDYEYSSACPCSLAMAKQYERQHEKGITQEGVGIAVSHSQRSRARVQVECAPDKALHIENLIDLLRCAIPTETQSMVKRIDEQAFAILNGEYPIFVEHAARRIHHELNSDKRILDWCAKIEHFESLHSHNAVAQISKGLPNGLKLCE